MGSAEKKVSARERARQKVAAQREAQRQRDLLNEKDLAAVLKAAEEIPAAEEQLQSAISAARQRFDDKVAAASADMGAALSAMRERGETVSDLAELTEFSEAEVRRLIKAHNGSATPQAATVIAPNASEETTAHGVHTGEAAGDDRDVELEPVGVGAAAPS